MKKKTLSYFSAILVFVLLFRPGASAFSLPFGGGTEADPYEEIIALKDAVFASLDGEKIPINRDVRLKMNLPDIDLNQVFDTFSGNVPVSLVLQGNTEGESNLFGFKIRLLAITVASGTLDFSEDGIGICIPEYENTRYILAPELIPEIREYLASDPTGTGVTPELIRDLSAAQLSEYLDAAAAEFPGPEGFELTASVFSPSTVSYPTAPERVIRTWEELQSVLDGIFSASALNQS